MNKSKTRKKILMIRKKYHSNNLEIDYKKFLKVLKKKILNKILGGYYPYNYEVDVIKILEKLEKQKYQICLPKIRKNSQMDFLGGVQKNH